MKKLVFIISLLPLWAYAQDNNNIKLGYNALNNITSNNTDIFGNKKPQTFIDTIEVIVLLHHLDDFEPSDVVTTKRVFMERKGDLVEYNMAKGNTLVYSLGWMKVPTETKIFYYNKIPMQIGHYATEYFNSDGSRKKQQVVIPKKQILQIYNIND